MKPIRSIVANAEVCYDKDIIQQKKPPSWGLLFSIRKQYQRFTISKGMLRTSIS